MMVGIDDLVLAHVAFTSLQDHGSRATEEHG